MSRVVIYGGLSRFGVRITEYLLDQEMVVASVYSGSSERAAEEECAMFFGRHAFFQTMDDNDWEAVAERPDAAVCLDSHVDFRASRSPLTKEELALRLETLLTFSPELQRIILLSHTDIYGEPSGVVHEKHRVAPVSAAGRQADAAERAAIETLLAKRETAPGLRVVVCRVPSVYEEGQKRSKQTEHLHVLDAASGVYRALTAALSPGLHVFQFGNGLSRFSFEKAAEQLGFYPAMTLKDHRG